MFYTVYVGTSLILIIGSILLGLFLIRRLGTSWTHFLLGAIVFLVSQFLYSIFASQIAQTDVFIQYIRDTSPINSWLVSGFLQALIQTVLCFLVIYFGWRLLKNQPRSWTGVLTIAAGFAGAVAIFGYASSTLTTILAKATFPAPGAPLPEGVTQEEYIAYQNYFNNLVNLPFIKLIIETQFIPALAMVVTAGVQMLITWVGAVQKKWIWLVSATLWQTAMIGLVYLLGSWMYLYEQNENLYLDNLVLGVLFIFALIAVNLGVIYGIYKFVLPLIPADAMQPPTIAPSKPASQVSPANQSNSRPAKRLKNTDLK